MPDIAHHIIQRGNNKQDVFFVDDDKEKFLELLGEREKRPLLNKMNMVIGAFFNETGTELLGHFNSFDTNPAKISEGFVCRYKLSGERPSLGRRSKVEKNTDGGVKMPFD